MSYANLLLNVLYHIVMEMKIRESCLQSGTFIYKPGISVTKQDFHLQMGSLGLQMGFSGYYLPSIQRQELRYDDIKQDMLNIVLIGLAKKLPRQDEKHELHRLLRALLSKSLTQSGKLNIIEKEYDIPLEEDLRKNFSRIRRQTGYGSFYKLLLTGVERIKIGHTNKKYGGMS